MQKINTKQLVICSLLACVSGLLSGPLSFYFGTWKISFGMIPVMLAGIMFGPLMGGLTGFVADVINFSLAPRGAYNPLFGLSFAIIGIICGIIYKNDKSFTVKKLVASTASSQLVSSFFLNSLILVFVFGASPAIFATRLVYNLAMIPLNACVLQIILTQVISRVNVLKNN